jgi:hypothetical protein
MSYKSHNRFRSSLAFMTVGTWLAMATSAATAACDVKGPELMFLGDNGNYDLAIKMLPNDHCQIHFESRGESVAFQAVSVSNAPNNSVLTKTGDFGFDYALKPGAKSDTFALKICGSDTRGKGCNVLRYAVSTR